jgi:hypothetical protein
MASRDDVYLAYGQLAELAQLLEVELGTALLAHDALKRKWYISPGADAARRLLEAIERHTLGQTLSAIRSRLDIKDDLSAIFDQALQARNVLMHSFFPKHGLAIDTDSGRDAMIRHLNDLRPCLEQAYRSAGYLSQLLIQAFSVLKPGARDDQEPKGEIESGEPSA